MAEPIALSLGNWPRNPLPDSYFQLTPNTSRTLKNAQIELSQVLPISLAEFRLANQFSHKKNTDMLDSYEEDRLRRQKKVEILQELWHKVSRKRKTYSSSERTSSIFQQELQRSSTKSYVKPQKKKASSPSPLIFKCKSPKQNIAYSDYYSISNKKPLSIKKKMTEDQSTKSRQKSSQRKGEYFESSLQKKRLHKSPNMKCKNMIEFMNQIMKRWGELDEQHAEQMMRAVGLSEKEKKRLLKIHKIEKEQLRKEIQNAKADLAANRKLSRHLL